MFNAVFSRLPLLVAALVFLLAGPAPAQLPPLPVAQYVLSADFAPTGMPVASLDLMAQADIEGDASFENLMPFAGFCAARPALRCRIYLDRGLTTPLRDTSNTPVEFGIDGVTVGVGEPGFDGALDFDGPSGDAVTSSRVHRSKRVHVDIHPDQQAALGSARRIYLKVTQDGTVTPHGAWRATIDQVRASLSAVVVLRTAELAP